MAKLQDRIVSWIAKEADGAVIGLSGGIDSSVTAVLASKALKERLLCLVMPCESSGEDERDAMAVAKKFGLTTERIDLTILYGNFLGMLPEADRKAKANLKARLRMCVLYYYANMLGYLVLGTGNRSEIETGYFTKYGDGGVDLLPLGGLYKTQVRGLAKVLGIPKKIIGKEPSAGLWEGQTDRSELGMSYEELDRVLMGKGKNKTVEKMERESEHKRRMPKIFMME